MLDKILQKITKESSDSKLIERAFRFAQNAHRGQKRESGEDFIIHPIKVAEILTEMRLDSQTIAAGFLHDVPDDTERTIEDIEKEFGKEIAFLVGGVSKLGKLRYPKEGLQTPPVEQRKEEPIDLRAENLRKMFFAMAEDLRVILIKLVDRLHNMQTLSALPPQTQRRIALETMEIFAPIAERLGMGEMRGSLEDLSFSYLYPKEHRWLLENVKEKYEKRTDYLQTVKPVLLDILKKEKIKVLDVHVRAKHYWSLYQKLLRYDMELDKIYDLVALRIIAKDTKTCYKILGIIHKHWKPLPGRIKDYIALPKPNRYRALHTTVFCLDGKVTEFQIKTPQMHQEAEYGICAHWAQKEKVDLQTGAKKFAWIAQLKDWQKEITRPKEFLEGLKIDFFKNRIFVFTPKGDVIDLPEEACPIDFAYAVHSRIGDHCAGAKINGKLSSLSQILKNGDAIEIIIDQSRKPSRDWLDSVKTSLARSHIKNWFKKESRPENLSRGLDILDQNFKQIQRTTFQNLPKNKKEELLKVFPYKDLESLIVAVGEGELSSKEILKVLIKEKDIFSPAKSRASAGQKRKASAKKETKAQEIVLAGQTGIQVHLSKCCLPQPGDEIKAYITKNRGASVHKVNCRNIIIAQKKWPRKIVEASWQSPEKAVYPVSLKIGVEDRLGLFKDITSVIAGMGINILSMEGGTQPKNKPTAVNIKVEISGFEELDRLFWQLKQIKGVTEVRKV